MIDFGLKLDVAFANLLLEEKHTYSTTHFTVNGALRKRILAFGADVPNDSLSDDGREDDSHVTIKYGLHTDDVNDVKEAIKGFKAFTVVLGKTSSFPALDDVGHDVLKIDVDGDALHRLNKLISRELECTDSHPTYKPHLTIAYLKPGKAAEYVGRNDFKGDVVRVADVIFASKDGKKTKIELADD